MDTSTLPSPYSSEFLHADCLDNAERGKRSLSPGGEAQNDSFRLNCTERGPPIW